MSWQLAGTRPYPNPSPRQRYLAPTETLREAVSGARFVSCAVGGERTGRESLGSGAGEAPSWVGAAVVLGVRVVRARAARSSEWWVSILWKLRVCWGL